MQIQTILMQILLVFDLGMRMVMGLGMGICHQIGRRAVGRRTALDSFRFYTI